MWMTASGRMLAEDVLGGALADVDLVHLDARRRVGPRAAIDADDLVPAGDEPLARAMRAEASGDARDRGPSCAAPSRHGSLAAALAADVDERGDARLHLLDVALR